jgi:cytochrome P450
LRPVAPLFFMESNVATVLEDVHLPAGSAVIFLMRRGAVDARRAGDAAEFRPARWRQGPDGTAPAAADERGLLKASIPFGAGPRLCPGRYVAMLEIKMVIATLARNFELVEVDTADGAPPQERLEFTMYPAGLRMALAARRR